MNWKICSVEAGAGISKLWPVAGVQWPGVQSFVVVDVPLQLDHQSLATFLVPGP